MLGPRLEGERGVALITPTLDHLKRNVEWMTQPEATRFWGVRAMDLRPERAEKRFKEQASDPTLVSWTIALDGEQSAAAEPCQAGGDADEVAGPRGLHQPQP